MKCFYHKVDLDGVCSATIVRYKHKECELIGVDYGESFPWNIIEKDEIVYMVDFALQPFEQMIKLYNSCNLIWIDHHKSAITEYMKTAVSIRGLREEGQAGCELTWQYLFSDVRIPEAVKYLGRYDIWDISNPEYMQFQYGMKSELNVMNPEAPVWNIITHTGLTNGVAKTLEKGKSILSYINNDFKVYAAKHAHEVQFEGMSCIAINRGCASSTLFDSMYEKNKHKLMIPYCKLPDGRWTISLYTTHTNIDCGSIAKKYGGGGHQQAAGFQCKELPF